MTVQGAISVVAVVAAVAAAIAAWWGVIQTTKDNRARSQPMIVAEFTYAPHSRDSIQLVVRNAGPTTARNVKVTLDPLPIDNGWGTHAWSVRERYENPIPSLAPEQVLRNSWWLTDYGVADMKERLLANQHELPSKVTVTAEYSGLGRKQQKVTYNLDVQLMQLESTAISSTSTLGRLGGIEKQLKEVTRRLGVVARILSKDDE